MNKKLINELKRRTGDLPFKLEDFCFKEQLEFIKDPARFKTACTSRRAGKSTAIAAEFIDCCLRELSVVCLYVAQTTRNARNILWPELKRLAENYKLNVKTDDTRMTMKFLDTGSEIRLGGAKDESQIENYRGWKLRKARIDEAQNYRPYLTYFVDDILMPALRDLRGDLAVTGTPGPVPSGPFYEYTHSKLWKHHHWTAFDNPHMLNLEETLKEERAVKGIDESDPSYIRETYGKWIQDDNALVYKFSKEKNLYDSLPDANLDKLEYIFGIDIGYEDADAIAVLGYSYITKNVYLIEEKITNKQDISSLVEQVKILAAQYKPVRMVMDAGALGRKIQEEVRQRHGIVLDAAEKVRKFEFIELMNDDLRTGKFKVPKGSRFEEDAYRVQWDRRKVGKLKISDSYHSDICDAVLYAWRECKHYFAEALPERLHRDSDAYMLALEDKLGEKLMESLKPDDGSPSQADIEELFSNSDEY